MAVDHVASTLQTLLSTSRGNCELRTIGYTIVQHLLENTGSGFVSCRTLAAFISCIEKNTYL